MTILLCSNAILSEAIRELPSPLIQQYDDLLNQVLIEFDVLILRVKDQPEQFLKCGFNFRLKHILYGHSRAWFVFQTFIQLIFEHFSSDYTNGCYASLVITNLL